MTEYHAQLKDSHTLGRPIPLIQLSPIDVLCRRLSLKRRNSSDKVYTKTARLADVLALIQVLALDEITHHAVCFEQTDRGLDSIANLKALPAPTNAEHAESSFQGVCS